ncbi:MAG: hypothetical protein HN368_09645 [Spirochaetales bacterium]|jgi:hypothetical protein|nr:hypothetical protein [Spirochaetales bacterium]
MNPYESLANAIVLLAVRDYRLALSRRNRHPEKDAFRQEKKSIERFFRSDWFGVLTGLDSEVLIGRLNKEVAV